MKNITKIVWVRKLWDWADENKIDVTELPRTEKDLFKISGLDLSNYKLNAIPIELFNLHKLKNLHLNANTLIKLPKEVEQLTNLTQLVINDNLLIDLPIEITNLKQLKWLEIYGNNLDYEKNNVLKKLTEQGCHVTTKSARSEQ